MSQENVEAVRAVYEEWGKGNFSEAGVDLYDPDILFIPRRDYAEKGRYLGTEGIAEFMRVWLASWKDITHRAEELIEAGDSVVVAVHHRGVGRESGIPIEMRYFEVWSFRGPTVIRFELFPDRTEAFQAVGLSE
jgi:ketosteroid isomerase-like protein